MILHQKNMFSLSDGIEEQRGEQVVVAWLGVQKQMLVAMGKGILPQVSQ